MESSASNRDSAGDSNNNNNNNTNSSKVEERHKKKQRNVVDALEFTTASLRDQDALFLMIQQIPFLQCSEIEQLLNMLVNYEQVETEKLHQRLLGILMHHFNSKSRQQRMGDLKFMNAHMHVSSE